MTEQKRSNLPWILAGCGALLLFACCLSSAGGLLFYRQQQASSFAEDELMAQERRRVAEEQARRAMEGSGPVLPPTFVGTPSVAVTATVTRAVGRRLTVRSGEPCAFTVEYPERSNAPGERWCHTELRCGGVLLYGGGTGGFFPCTFSLSPASVRGTDDETTSGDRDGAMTIDTAAGVLRVRDDSAGDYGTFQLDATITRTM